MKRKLLLIVMLAVIGVQSAFSQCDPWTPAFSVNLSSDPDSTWISPNVSRSGDCCSGTGQTCVMFTVTLHALASGINFNIASGALPTGSLFYQVNCGPLTTIGTPICLNGAGPHVITFCKPGGNTNTYSITSIPAPAASGNITVTQACTATMSVQGLDSTTVTWTSIPPNATYNSYLSCQSGCNTTVVTPTPGYPPFVDYQVCGSTTGPCASASFCDTIRVFFVNNLAANITPVNPVLCAGPGNTIMVTANPSGGATPYTYVWSTGATTQSITVGPGTYTVTVSDALNCGTANATVTVTALPSPITANAGPDVIMCTNDGSVTLNGAVQVATGGIWSGGAGTFSPNNTTLNATYTPTAGEISSGSVTLTLTTTGNQGCPAVTDAMTITIVASPATSISGSLFRCAGSTSGYFVSNVAGNTYAWSVTGGTINGSSNTSSINVQWGTGSSGTITITQTNPQGCDSTVTATVTIIALPVITITGPPSVCRYDNATYSISTPAGNTNSWSVTGGAISGSSTNNSVNIIWGNSTSGIVTVTQTNVWGCINTGSMNVTLNPQPASVITGNTTVCKNTTTSFSVATASGNTFGWNVTGGSISSGQNTNSISVLWGSGSSGTVSITQTNSFGCDSTVTVNISLMSPPVPVISGNNNVCANGAATYSVTNTAGNTYLWSATGGTINGSTNTSSVSIQWSSGNSGTVTVTQTNQWGCVGTATLNVTLLPLPVISISGPASVCKFDNTNYSASTPPGSNNSWSVSGGAISGSSTSNSVTIIWGNSNSGTVTVIQTDNLGCSSTASINVTLNPQPVPVITGSTTVCQNTSSSYNVANSSVSTFSWNVTGGTITNGTNTNAINVLWGTGSSGVVMITQTNQFGCDSTVSKNVTIMAPPSPVITGSNVVCASSTVPYSVANAPGNTFNWSVTGGSIIGPATSSSINVTWGAQGTGTVTLTQTNQWGCVANVPLTVTIVALPVVTISAPANLCLDVNTLFSVNLSPGETAVWTVSGGTIAGPNNTSALDVGWASAGMHSVTVTVTNSSGCTATSTSNVFVETPPAPLISGPSPVCEYDTAQYSVPFLAGHFYNWSITGGSIIGFSVGNTVDVQWGGFGSGTLTCHQIAPSGCDSTVTKSFLINQKPSPLITGSVNVCENSDVIYSVTTTPGSNYTWSVFGGTFNGSSNVPSVSIHWNTGGSGSVTVTETNSSNCSVSTTLPISINLRPTVTIAGSSAGCVNANGTYSTTWTPNTNFVWTVSGGGIISGNGTTSIDVDWFVIGNNSVTLTLINTITGCSGTLTLPVQVDIMSAPVVNAGVMSGCAPLAVMFSGNNSTTGQTFQWDFGDGFTSGAANPTHFYMTPGNYTVSVISQNGGCVDSSTGTVTVHPNPIASFTHNYVGTNYYIGESYLMINNTSIGGNSYEWTFGTTDTANAFEPIYTYYTEGDYLIQLVVTSIYGCSDTAIGSIHVRKHESIFIPNTFTPNDNSLNDYFSVVADNLKALNVIIFDRWGEIIYTSDDMHFRWDGTTNGERAQQGVYGYIITAEGYSGEAETFKGTLTLLR